MSESDKKNTDLSNLDLNFAPDWARTSADDYAERYRDDSFERRERSFDRRPPRRSDHGDFRSDRGEGGDRRMPRRDDRRNDRRPPRRDDRVPGEQPQFSQEPATSTERREAPRRYQPREFVQPVDAEIRILPGQKQLGVIMKRIQNTHLAYPIKSFVGLFLDNPQACLVRLEAKKENPITFYQCKKCGYIALTAEEVMAHISAVHFTDCFDVIEEDCPPPSGTFSCVNRCAVTGEWLGAPNHHSYRRRVAELAARLHMSEDRYRTKIETLRDPESIEAWKQTLTKKKVYQLKNLVPVAPVAEKVPVPAEPTVDASTDAPTETPDVAEVPVDTPAPTPVVAPPMDQDSAELYFNREFMPQQIASAKHVCCAVSIADQTTSEPIRFLLRQTLRNELYHPRSLFTALRGAFRHRKFFIFRANDSRGQEFVTSKTPGVLDKEHAVAVLKQALTFVEEHPLCTKHELVANVTDGIEDATKKNEVLAQVAWLLSKGHVIEYYNGTVALPADYPVFRKTPAENARAKGKEGAPAESTTKPSEETSAPSVEDSTPEATPEGAPAVETVQEPETPVEASPETPKENE